MRSLALLPLLLGFGVSAQAATDASQWLNRLTQAEQQQSYQGTFVYERSGLFSTHDIWHRVQAGKVSERMLQLDGPVQEMVRVDGKATCVSSAPASGLDQRADASRPTLDPLRLMSWYDLAVAGESRVAGRPTVTIDLTPKDPHRYGFSLSLDKQTGLALKTLLLDDQGRMLERLQFTRFQPAVPEQAQLAASKACRPVQAATSVTTGDAPVNWRSDWLPPGFELLGSSLGRDEPSQSVVTRQVYGDGLARFSVFFEPLAGATAADTRLQLGPTVAVSRRVDTPKGKVMVTVVGEIPVGTAERIALSMRLQDAQAGQ